MWVMIIMMIVLAIVFGGTVASALKNAKSNESSTQSKLEIDDEPTIEQTQQSIGSVAQSLSARAGQLRRERSGGNAARDYGQKGHHESHCDIGHKSDDRYRVEKVPVMNSIGGRSTEGCQEHYDLRFVKIDETSERKLELTDLQKIVVYGEILNEPAFKRGFKRR